MRVKQSTVVTEEYIRNSVYFYPHLLKCPCMFMHHKVYVITVAFIYDYKMYILHGIKVKSIDSGVRLWGQTTCAFVCP